jgi:AraC family transcriptional regulator
MTEENSAAQVRIVDVEATKVAAFEHRGDPGLIGNSIRKFVEWRKQSHLPPSASATFNIIHNAPDPTNPDDFRIDLCAATERDIADNPADKQFGIVGKTIPAGRCALLRHVGSDDNLGETITYLYAQWLPQSGEALRHFPLYFQRVSFFPQVPEEEAITDVFLPLE